MRKLTILLISSLPLFWGCGTLSQTNRIINSNSTHTFMLDGTQKFTLSVDRSRFLNFVVSDSANISLSPAKSIDKFSKLYGNTYLVHVGDYDLEVRRKYDAPQRFKCELTIQEIIYESNLDTGGTLQRWFDATRLSNLMQLQGIYRFSDTDFIKLKKFGMPIIDVPLTNRSVIFLKPKTQKPLALTQESDIYLWQPLLNHTREIMGFKPDSVMLFYNQNPVAAVIFQNGGSFHRKQPQIDFLGGEVLTKEYIKKGNTLWNVENTGIEDITNLCQQQDHAISRKTFEMTLLTKDFYDFIGNFFMEKPKANLERTYDDFSFEATVRGLHGEVIEKGAEWEKIKIICTHSTIMDPYRRSKCIYRVDVMLSTCSGIGRYPDDNKFKYLMNEEYFGKCAAYERKLCFGFRQFLNQKYIKL